MNNERFADGRGYLSQHSPRFAERKRLLEQIAREGDTPELRTKAREMAQGKRSLYEVFQDPDFGREIMKSFERVEEYAEREGIDLYDQSTYPTPEELDGLDGFGDDPADESNSEWRSGGDSSDHPGFGAGSREEL